MVKAGAKRPKSGNGARPQPRGAVLVTGAAGSVGGYVVDELLGRGYQVVATDRPDAPRPAAHRKLRWKAADLTDPTAAAGLVEGVEAVIHTAAWVDIAVPFEVQAPINLYAVRYLHEAATAAGVAYFLHFSTGSLYAAKDAPINEDDPALPTSAYERAKLLAEDYLRTRRGTGPLVNMLRPALIYGPRGRVLLAPLATLPTMLHFLDGWIPRLRGGPHTNIVHCHDVARAAVHLLEHRQPDGATFNVATDEILAAGDLLRIALEVAGMNQARLEIVLPGGLLKAIRPLLGFPGPFAALNAGARALWQLLTHDLGLEGGLQPRVDMEATTYLGGDTVFDASRLKATGFEFLYPTFETGWRDTLDWYRANHWIPTAAEPEVREVTASAPLTSVKEARDVAVL